MGPHQPRNFYLFTFMPAAGWNSEELWNRARGKGRRLWAIAFLLARFVGRGCEGEGNFERRSLARNTVYGDGALMFLDDAMNHGQP